MNIRHMTQREGDHNQMPNTAPNSTAHPEPKRVSFTLPKGYQDKNSTVWRAVPRRIRISNTRQKWENAKYRRKKRNGPLSEKELQAAVLDGTVPSGISDTGATSSAGKTGDPFHHTNKPSNKLFHLPTGGMVKATTQAKLMRQLREPARSGIRVSRRLTNRG